MVNLNFHFKILQYMFTIKNGCFKENIAGCCSPCGDQLEVRILTTVNVSITLLHAINGQII